METVEVAAQQDNKTLKSIEKKQDDDLLKSIEENIKQTGMESDSDSDEELAPLQDEDEKESGVNKRRRIVMLDSGGLLEYKCDIWSVY